MPKSFYLLYCAAICSVLTGCATPMERVALSTESKKHIKQLDQNIIVEQNNIQPTYQQAPYITAIDPASLAAALIIDGVLAVSVMHENSLNEKLMAPLIKQTHENEFANDFQKSLIAQLQIKKTFGNLNKPAKIVATDPKHPHLLALKIRRSAAGKAYFNIPVQYQLNERMDAFWVKASPELVLKEKSRLKTLYKNNLTYLMPLPHTSRNKQINIKHWTANNGRLIHNAFKDAAYELARLIIEDLKPIDNKTLLSINKYKVNTALGRRNHVGILSNKNNKLIIRNNDGSIWITSGQVLS